VFSTLSILTRVNLKKILIASVLKPVDDVRHYKKLALSLAKANKYQIIILGKGTEKNSQNSSIHFIPTGNFNRLNLLRRLFVQVKFIQQVILKNPDLIIITTIELLPISAVLKFIYRYELIYDVQEIYSHNVKYQNEYAPISKLIFLPVIKIFETFHFMVDHFILAERSYLSMFINKILKTTVLENKTTIDTSISHPIKWQFNEPLRLLFSGSISDYSGIQLALKIFNDILVIHNNTKLVVIGCCQDIKLMKLLKQTSYKNNKIELIIDSNPINHDLILDQISQAHLGIIAYTPNKTNQDRIPTKLYEYAAYGLPFIIHNHPVWRAKCKEINSGFTCDITKIDAELILKRLDSYEPIASTPAIWEQEEQQLLKVINSLI
jgi:glycogen synthase